VKGDVRAKIAERASPVNIVNNVPLLLLVTLKPAIDNRKILVKYGKRLMQPLFVTPRFTPYRLLDRVT